jgi:hypothetical protein
MVQAISEAEHRDQVGIRDLHLWQVALDAGGTGKMEKLSNEQARLLKGGTTESHVALLDSEAASEQIQEVHEGNSTLLEVIQCM